MTEKTSQDEAKKLLESVSANIIGQRLRRARLRQGLSIRDLATKAEVSKTSVVRIEQGEPAHATTVTKICGALGLHLAGLAAPDPDESITALHKSEDDRWFDMTDFGAGPIGDHVTPQDRAQAALNGMDVGLLFLKNRLKGGMILPALLEIYGESESRSHAGEEMVYVINGELKIKVGPEEHILKSGECITFWSAEEHSYRPADPNQVPVTALSIRIDYARTTDD